MKQFMITCALIILVFISGNAQQVQADSLAKAEIAKIQFMEGEWKGSGWMMARDGSRHEFEQTEDVRLKLDGTIMLIEGVGKSDGHLIHNAVAVISYDKEKQQYNFQSWMIDGRSGVFKGEVIEGKFVWYPYDGIRYIIEINEKGQWYETGEMNRGGEWMQFFEMTLDRS